MEIEGSLKRVFMGQKLLQLVPRIHARTLSHFQATESALPTRVQGGRVGTSRHLLRLKLQEYH
jgi:hypothetical protein